MRKFSRLARKEEKRSIRQAIFYGGLIFILALGIIFLGIPVLIKMAIFLGNLRSSSMPVELKDTLPPTPPVLKPLPEATNSAQLVVGGFAESGATVKIFLTGGEEKEVVADNEGTFTFDNLKLTLGKNEIYALATDKAGNKSVESEKIIVWYDNTPPELEITQPTDKMTISEEDNKLEVIGKTDPEATVLVNEHLVVVDREGNFKYPLTLSLGENEIKIMATDKAGNQTEKSLIITYSL
jgi:bacillopeptidase F